MTNTTLERRAYEIGRSINRCPVCGWRFFVNDDEHVDEMFCARCESRLVANDDDSPRRWVQAGVYT